MDTSQPVALITGSTSGIGAAIAQKLSKEGFHVILHSRQSTEAGQVMAKRLSSATYIQADLAIETDRVQLVREAIGIRGRLDVLVNNVGFNQVIPHANLAEATAEIWHEHYEVNVIAPFRLVAEAESALRASSTKSGRPSSVVNISSHAGVRPKGASIPYAASKAALNHMTSLLALTLAPQIRVNAVAPGLVNTPRTQDWSRAQNLWAEHAPMGRSASPEDIADVVALLVSADYLTGEILLADGGLNLT